MRKRVIKIVLIILGVLLLFVAGVALVGYLKYRERIEDERSFKQEQRIREQYNEPKEDDQVAYMRSYYDLLTYSISSGSREQLSHTIIYPLKVGSTIIKTPEEFDENFYKIFDKNFIEMIEQWNINEFHRTQDDYFFLVNDLLIYHDEHFHFIEYDAPELSKEHVLPPGVAQEDFKLITELARKRYPGILISEKWSFEDDRYVTYVGDLPLTFDGSFFFEGYSGSEEVEYEHPKVEITGVVGDSMRRWKLDYAPEAKVITLPNGGELLEVSTYCESGEVLYDLVSQTDSGVYRLMMHAWEYEDVDGIGFARDIYSVNDDSTISVQTHHNGVVENGIPTRVYRIAPSGDFEQIISQMEHGEELLPIEGESAVNGDEYRILLTLESGFEAGYYNEDNGNTTFKVGDALFTSDNPRDLAVSAWTSEEGGQYINFIGAKNYLFVVDGEGVRFYAEYMDEGDGILHKHGDEIYLVGKDYSCVIEKFDAKNVVTSFVPVINADIIEGWLSYRKIPYVVADGLMHSADNYDDFNGVMLTYSEVHNLKIDLEEGEVAFARYAVRLTNGGAEIAYRIFRPEQHFVDVIYCYGADGSVISKDRSVYKY